MKLTKTASGKTQLKLTKAEWKAIGKRAGWDYHMKQVCQLHGKPDDIVICPFRYCQCGRVPEWIMGMPAGTRECTFCKGKGEMLRKDKPFLPPDNASDPPCICWSLKNN